MMCAWIEFLAVLPPWMRHEVDMLGKSDLQELRMRVNAPPELVRRSGIHILQRIVEKEDIRFCVNAASNYSPWAAAGVSQGYITAPGGHRIGLCGEAVIKNGEVTGLRDITSLCVRIARDFPGIGISAAKHGGSLLVIGAPGWGKTTLLRDIARQISKEKTVAVVDERGELFPVGFSRGKRMDVLTGCPKPAGMDMVLRTMGPDYIALDEITAEEDCRAVIRAVGCGVRLLATAHASSMEDFQSRPIYAPLITYRIFETVIILHSDKSFHVERMDL